MLRVGIVAAASLWAGLAQAADQPIYAPPPAWVKPIPIPDAPATPSGAAVQVLLSDNQTRFGPDGDEFYGESAFRILAPAALGLAGAITPSWNPETETLILHRLNVVRGGQTIDLLDGGKKVTVLRRETNLELAMLDGNLTATWQPEGLQVGDVIDMAFTLRRRDPVMQGNSEGSNVLPQASATSRVFMRAIWPSTKPIRWRATDGLPAPKISRTSDGVELSIDATDVTALKPPAGAPIRYADLGQLEFSQFADWADVSKLVAPLYAKAESLAATSPLKLEADKIRKAATDPKARAAAALRLVQDQVRYAFLGMNLGGYVPADAEVTWSRRFGDCKGKTVLLLALLNELGIDAQPVLVSTTLGDGLDQRLPQMTFFDHVLVRAEIAGKAYWLDGTRVGDRDIDDIQTPNFHWGLPVQKSGAELVKLTPGALKEPDFESLLRLDASAGMDAPAPAHAENIFRGDAAVAWNLALNAQGRDDAQRSLREFWQGQRTWIDVKHVDFSYDDARRTMRLVMDGSATIDWAKSGNARDFQISDSSLGFDASFKREPGMHADAPFSVSFPSYHEWTVVITLPTKGSGFGLVNAGDIDQSVAGRRYQRQTRIQDGVVTMTSSETSLTQEFPAAEAPAAAEALRQLNEYDVTVRNTASASATVDADDDDLFANPTGAAGFDIRAARYLAKGDYGHAIADLDQAVRLDPASSKYLYNRGVAHFENDQYDLAMADLNTALRLKADDPLALQARAQLYLRKEDVVRARQDFASAARLSPGDKKVLAREAAAFESAGRYDDAIGVLNQSIATAPTAALYNDRCWVRAEAGHDLEAGLADCDAALKLNPDAPDILDSRGFMELRLGRFGDAIKTYDDALKSAPSQAPSLYGRGIAKLRTGEKQAGAADIAAAKALSPDVDATFARLGVRP